MSDLAAVVAGAIGFAATKFAAAKLIQPRTAKKIVESDDEVLQKPSPVEVVPEKVSPADSAVEVEVEAPKKRRTRKAKVAAEVEATSPAEEPPSTEVVPQGSVVVSDRVAKLLAKKAARKARKALERSANVNAAAESHEAALDVQAAPEVAEDQEVAEPSCLPASEGANSEELSASGEETSEQVSYAVDADVSIGEMSTGDEVLAWGDVECDDSLDELEIFVGEEWEEVSDEEYFQEEVYQGGGPSWAPWQGYQMPQCDDAWMVPFDELIRPPAMAAFEYISPAPEVVPAPCPVEMPVLRKEFVPVMSADGQQLYTDGEQYFMLACLEAPQDEACGEPMVRPIVDPADPLFKSFLEDFSVEVEPLPPAPAGDDGWNSCW